MGDYFAIIMIVLIVCGLGFLFWILLYGYYKTTQKLRDITLLYGVVLKDNEILRKRISYLESKYDPKSNAQPREIQK